MLDADLLRCPVVTMVQAAESRAPDHLAASRRTRSATRRLFGQAEMRSIFMIVADVIGEQPLQMSLVECDYVIEQVPATAPYPTFSNSILPRAPVAGLNSADLHRPDGNRNFQAILGIAVKDKPARGRVEWESLSELLDDPHARGMLGDVEVQNLPSVMANHKEAVQHAEVDRRECEEIHRSHCFAMVLEKD
jgi:hypothetical protein